MTPTCGSCHYWDPITADEEYFNPPPIGGKRSVDKWADWPGEWGTCARESYPGSPMFTNDASDYFSALRTRSTHYCSAYQAPHEEEQ